MVALPLPAGRPLPSFRHMSGPTTVQSALTTTASGPPADLWATGAFATKRPGSPPAAALPASPSPVRFLLVAPWRQALCKWGEGGSMHKEGEGRGDLPPWKAVCRKESSKSRQRPSAQHCGSPPTTSSQLLGVFRPAGEGEERQKGPGVTLSRQARPPSPFSVCLLPTPAS